MSCLIRVRSIDVILWVTILCSHDGSFQLEHLVGSPFCQKNTFTLIFYLSGTTLKSLGQSNIVKVQAWLKVFVGVDIVGTWVSVSHLDELAFVHGTPKCSLI